MPTSKIKPNEGDSLMAIKSSNLCELGSWLTQIRHLIWDDLLKYLDVQCREPGTNEKIKIISKAMENKIIYSQDPTKFWEFEINMIRQSLSLTFVMKISNV